MTVNNLIKQIKNENEDFEFYPTTQEIVNKIGEVIKSKKLFHYQDCVSILDIGCGNGNFFEKLKLVKDLPNIKKYGIEKSNILINNLPDDVILIGTDFYEQNLIDKKVGMIFCNPPYSDFENWAEKIILQGNCKNIILVIPDRWVNSDKIKTALKKRNFNSEVVGSYSFVNAERKARANVDIVLINNDTHEGYCGRFVETNPFDVWFEDTFKINADKKTYAYDYESNIKKNIENEIISSGDKVEMLLKFYNQDLEKLYKNYKSLESMDYDIFKELNIDIEKIKESLQIRLRGLKNIYWNLLFDKYDNITKRLTSNSKRKIINRLNDNTSIDFTLNNIFEITLWVIKNSNKLFDEQIKDYFFDLCSPEAIQKYKSNKHWNEDDWKYIKSENKYYCDKYEKKNKIKEMECIKLDYRLIYECGSTFEYWCSNSYLTKYCITFLKDTLVIADNLGFKIDFEIPEDRTPVIVTEWKNINVFYNQNKLFANFKLYQNGNIHIKFCEEFIKKLNIEMARINNWINDKSDIMNEFDIPAGEINKYWNTNFKIGIESVNNILGLPEIK